MLQYEIIKKISQGNFGVLYKGRNIITNEFVAIKIEQRSNMSSLKNEARILKYLGNMEGFSQLKWYENMLENSFIVMSLLGPSITSMVHKYSGFKFNNVLSIGIQMITRLKQLHNKLIIHRDIKPSNFVVGLNNKSSTIYLIDFGFAKNYMKNNVHIENCFCTEIVGSNTFVSLNVHANNKPSRRDDIESCLYVMLYMYFGKLEWSNYTDIDNIIKTKKNIIYIHDIPICIKNAIIYVQNIHFSSVPDYDYIIEELLKSKTSNDVLDEFEWNKYK